MSSAAQASAIETPYRIDTRLLRKQSSKRKRDEVHHDIACETPKGFSRQVSPLDGRLFLDYFISYKLGGGAQPIPWEKLTRVKSFQPSDRSKTFHTGDIVLVRNHDNDADHDDNTNGYYENFWVAQILEIRYSDSDHVYCRVFWLYRPDETATGRQEHHGDGEVLVSNHMEIVDACTIDCKPDVAKIMEDDASDDPTMGYTDHCYRYSYDAVKARELDIPKLVCICQSPFNPDDPPVRCRTKEGCGRLMHTTCLTNTDIRKLNRHTSSSEARASVPPRSKLPQALANIVTRAKSVPVKSPNIDGSSAVKQGTPYDAMPCLLCGRRIGAQQERPNSDPQHSELTFGMNSVDGVVNGSTSRSSSERVAKASRGKRRQASKGGPEEVPNKNVEDDDSE